ncbi:MAG: DUF2809 domain-containing protein [Myxococcales bacterium]|nr:DUF2809 domain-containing protein [Myxococcales bacterium]
MQRPWVRCLLLSAAWFAVLVAIVLWGRGWIRASFGDLAVVPWVIHSVGIVPVLAPRIVPRVVFGLGLACTLEGLQLLGNVGPDDPLWMHLIFGSTFDPMDLVHYVVGALVAFGLEHRLVRPTVHRP